VSYTLTLTLTLAACFGLQSFALHRSGGKTNKSESNFFSSLARIQTGIRSQPEVMLLGSSITGRLPDRSSGFAGVANLGCDGSSAADTLEAMDAGRLPIAPKLIIEGNTLYRSASGATSEIGRAIASPWFQVGNQIPNLGATARPAAFAYSRLLAGKIGLSPGPVGEALPCRSLPHVAVEAQDLPAAADPWVSKLAALLKRLEARGCQCLLVIIPPGANGNSLNIRIPRELSRRSQVPLLDLTDGLPPGAVLLTDGVHLAPQSAAETLRAILKNFP